MKVFTHELTQSEMIHMYCTVHYQSSLLHIIYHIIDPQSWGLTDTLIKFVFPLRFNDLGVTNYDEELPSRFNVPFVTTAYKLPLKIS